jgi:hypothetical protein
MSAVISVAVKLTLGDLYQFGIHLVEFLCDQPARERIALARLSASTRNIKLTVRSPSVL